MISDTLKCSKDLLETLSTHFLICNEKIEGHGEDSGFEAYTCEAGIAGAFDGCGGLGAKTCPSVSGKTEAYLASRAVGDAVRQWFYANADAEYQWDLESLKRQIISNLEICKSQTETSGLKLRGSMVRPFPSTLAMITFRAFKGKLRTRHIWAGDSRTYLLDRNGLAQISLDDIEGEDALSNLTKDGALTNVISADCHFELHSVDFVPQHPCILFSATDGCFGYVPSPMEFERMILAALAGADNVAQWQKALNDDIFERSGDDQTLALAAFGFDSFSDMKKHFARRYMQIEQIVTAFNEADSNGQQALWENYSPGYYRYIAKKE